MAKRSKAPAGPRISCKVRRVIDGDTVIARRSRGCFLDWLPAPEFRLRLQNIDAWESDQALGGPSTKALRKMTPPGKKFWMASAGPDQYGREIATLHPGKNSPEEESYNYRMVRQGYAKAYMAKGELGRLYGQAQREAQAAKRGNWKSGKSKQDPAAHRRRQREQARQNKQLTAWILLILLALAAVALLLLAAQIDGPLKEALPFLKELGSRLPGRQ